MKDRMPKIIARRGAEGSLRCLRLRAGADNGAKSAEGAEAEGAKMRVLFVRFSMEGQKNSGVDI